MLVLKIHDAMAVGPTGAGYYSRGPTACIICLALFGLSSVTRVAGFVRIHALQLITLVTTIQLTMNPIPGRCTKGKVPCSTGFEIMDCADVAV